MIMLMRQQPFTVTKMCRHAMETKEKLICYHMITMLVILVTF